VATEPNLALEPTIIDRLIAALDEAPPDTRKALQDALTPVLTPIINRAIGGRLRRVAKRIDDIQERVPVPEDEALPT
jgi:hypothetical protein